MGAVIGFGLDLAGYTTNKTSLVAIEATGSKAVVTMLKESAFSAKRGTDSSVDEAINKEGEALRKCLTVGPIAVDIPIDLQGLPFPEHPKQIWELTKRPIDKELRAMSPLADRIGAPVARFSAIMRQARLFDALGTTIFETYPTAILRRLGFTGPYKSRKKDKAEEKRKACVALCEFLSIRETILDDDDLDAIICAITAVATTESLVGVHDYDIDARRLPRGFRLLKKNPFKEIQIKKEAFSPWIDVRT
jgi:predicted nuclease with RNAse H fold